MSSSYLDCNEWYVVLSGYFWRGGGRLMLLKNFPKERPYDFPSKNEWPTTRSSTFLEDYFPPFFFWRALRAFNAHWGAFQAAHTNTTLQGKHPSLLPPSGPSALARRVTTRGLDSSPRFWMLFSRLISWGGIDWIQSWWRSEDANFSLEWVDSWRLSSIRWVAEGYIEAASINRSGPRCSAFSSVGASSESTAATLLLCISRSVRFVLSNCGLVISPVSSKFKKFKSKKHFATEIPFVISV